MSEWKKTVFFLPSNFFVVVISQTDMAVSTFRIPASRGGRELSRRLHWELRKCVLSACKQLTWRRRLIKSSILKFQKWEGDGKGTNVVPPVNPPLRWLIHPGRQFLRDSHVKISKQDPGTVENGSHFPQAALPLCFFLILNCYIFPPFQIYRTEGLWSIPRGQWIKRRER